MINRSEIFNTVKVCWKAVLAIAIAVSLNIVLIALAGSARVDFLKKNEDLNVLSAKKSNLMQLERQFEDIAATAEKVEKSFINDENVVDFIILI